MLSLTELGNRLKEAREQKNISLDQLQSLTKIQKRYLIGIEEGNYDSMPGKFYVRAFIKQYAEVVGLDPEKIFEEYKAEVPNTYNENLPEQLSRVQSRKSLSPKNEKILKTLPKILTAVVIFLVAVAVWVIMQKFSDNSNGNQAGPPEENSTSEFEQSADSPLKDNQTDENEESEKTDETESEQVKSEEDTPEKPVQKLEVVETNNGNSTLKLSNTDKFVLEIRSTGKSWVSISNGKGHRFYYDNLTVEDQVQKYDFTNETEINLNIGRSTEAEIKINDEVFQYPVDPKEMVSQKIKIQFQKQ